MIKNKEEISLAEVKALLAKEDEDESKQIKDILAHIKKFVDLSPEKAKKMKEELKELDIIKIGNRHIAKIIDLLPDDAESLRKILSGEEVSLDENEINKILEVVKKYK